MSMINKRELEDHKRISCYYAPDRLPFVEDLHDGDDVILDCVLARYLNSIEC